MTLRPTNVYRRLGDEFAYSIHTQLDEAALRRALAAVSGRCDEAEEFADETASTVWTAVLPLGEEFEPEDVSVKLDDAGAFWVTAEAESTFQEGDFARVKRRVQLPIEEVDTGSVRCWVQDDILVVQADRLTGEKAADKKKSASTLWPKCSLADSRQRQGSLVKESGKGHRGNMRWTLDLALPEFQPEEVTVTRCYEQPGRLLVTAQHAGEGLDVVDSSVKLDYRREIQVPAGVHLEQLVTRFGANGVLHLEAPAPGMKSRRGVAGLVGAASGGAGAKIASLTRELRGVGGAAAGGSSGGGVSGAASPSSVGAATKTASLDRNAVPAGRAKNCVVQ